MPPTGRGRLASAAWELPEQTARRRGGCRGCFLTCLVLLIGCAALAVVVVAAGVYLVRQSAPTPPPSSSP